MKNIHLISTDKPSRLHEFGGTWFSYKEPSKSFRNYKMYITNSEEIKEGDWVITNGGLRFVTSINNDKSKTFTDDGSISKQSPSPYCYLEHYKKIILTTDQDLIKDGIQAIDDEFLEWFVRNPSCVRVEVEKESHIEIEEVSYEGDFQNVEYISYKIIIPKEEPKQLTVEEALLLMRKTPMTFVPDKRMYSEEDVKEAFRQRQDNMDYSEMFGWYSKLTEQQWFEQFKKK
jgi:hypothetical protein